MAQVRKQSAADLARGLYQQVQKTIKPVAQTVGNFVRQDMQRAPVVQSVSNIRRVAQLPQFQQTVRQAPARAINAVASQPLVNFNPVGLNMARPNPYSPSIGQYARGQVIQPIQQGVKLTRQPGVVNKGAGILQTAGGALSATPVGALWNVGSGMAAGLARSIRTRQPLNQSINQAIAQPSSIGTEGLGIKNPYLAMGVDLAITRKPSSSLRDIKKISTIAQRLKGYSPNMYKVHPDDLAIMDDFIRRVRGGGAKSALGKAGKDAQRLAEHYVGERARNLSNAKLAKVFESVINKSEGYPTKFPSMGLVGKKNVANAGLSDTAQLEFAKKYKTFDDFKHAIGLDGTGSTGPELAAATRKANELAQKYGSLENFWRQANDKKPKVSSQMLGLNSQPYIKLHIGKDTRIASELPTQEVRQASTSVEGNSSSNPIISPRVAQQPIGDINGQRASLLSSTSQNIGQATDPTQLAKSGTAQDLLDKKAIRSANDLPKSNLQTSQGIVPPAKGDFNADEYIKELTQKQKSAGSVGPKGLVQRGRNVLSEIKAKLVDSTAPIQDALDVAEKKGKFKVLPKDDIRMQIDRVLRSRNLAGQFADDNGFTDVIKQAPDLNALDQYMIAKQARRVSELGKATGRDAAKDAKLIEQLAPVYEQHAQQVNQYSRKLLDYSVDSGLIDKGLADELVKKYPDYVPLNRIFNELEQTDFRGGTKAVASLSRQSVVQKLEGSEREIASPIESLLLKTQTAFEQGEKNKAARMLASYEQLPGLKELVRPLKSGESSPHTFSYLENGVKKSFATTPEIAAAAKNLNQEQMNIVLKVLAIPTRVLQLGATGVNLPFTVTNVAKDQVVAFVNSNKAARTSLLNPINFGRALFSAVKHDDLYDEVVRNAAGGTSFDISRQAPNLSVEKIRAGRNLGSKVAYTVTRPAELLRALEDVIGRGEELTRIQQYKGTYQALIKEGRTPQDARLLAAKAARENTANFARKGDIGKVINYVIPFFNAGIQGARAFVRSMQTRPMQTGSKLAVAVFMPIAATTAWNLSDPKRKQAYEDIDKFEKENNLILIPENPTQDEKGRWNVIKVPLPPGLSNLGSIVRRSMETASGLDPIKFAEVANNLFTAGTSLDLSSTNKVASTFTPQIVKPFIEGYTNTNLFTGKKIVPDSLADLPAEAQARPYTSGTARFIGKAMGKSPLKVENFIRTSTGGAGSQVLNIADTALNKLGIIPEEQVGGEGAGSMLERRFKKASGGYIQEKGYTDVKQFGEESALARNERKVKAEQLYKELKQLPPDQAFEKYKALKDSDELQFNALKRYIEDEKLGLTSTEKAIKNLGVEDFTRSKYIAQEFKRLKTREDKARLWNEWVKKKIITKDVVKQLNYMKEEGQL